MYILVYIFKINRIELCHFVTHLWNDRRTSMVASTFLLKPMSDTQQS